MRIIAYATRNNAARLSLSLGLAAAAVPLIAKGACAAEAVASLPGHTHHRGIFAFDRVRYSTISSYSAKMAPTALVVLAGGAEEIETVAAVDVMRRGEIDVTLAGLDGTAPVKCSRNVVLVPDVSLDEAIKKGDYDAVVLPGGLGGAKANAASPKVGELLQRQQDRGGYIAMICAGPLSLISHHIGKGKKVTSHPSIKDELVNAGYQYSEDRCVTDQKLITSRGPGTSIEFGLALVEALQGAEKRAEVAKPMVLHNGA